MNKRKHFDHRPSILGMTWTPGDLILVGSRSWGGRLEYVLGNCIVNGTGEEIPVALFTPKADRYAIMRMLMRTQLGSKVFDEGQFSAKDLKEYPLYIDNTSNLTIPYLVGQIFRFVEEKDVRMIVINRLQDIYCDIMDEGSREGELDAALRLLKALAESLSIVIIVVSKLSRSYIKKGGEPTVRDILEVTEAEEHCDQIILLHPLDPFLENAKMILPLGHPYCEGKCELVLNVSLDRDKHYFKKATALFEEKDDSFEDTPMYQWQPGLSEGEWTFEFMDAEGMGWNLILEPIVEEETHYYQISVQNWASEEDLLDDYVDLDDIELIKAIALEMARKRFPEVEIPDSRSGK